MVAPAARIVRNGRIAELTKARKDFVSRCCGLMIEKGSSYYSVTYAGAGLGSIKYPQRCHINCIDKFLGDDDA